jgi:hypothetical protein
MMRMFCEHCEFTENAPNQDVEGWGRDHWANCPELLSLPLTRDDLREVPSMTVEYGAHPDLAVYRYGLLTALLLKRGEGWMGWPEGQPYIRRAASGS